MKIGAKLPKVTLPDRSDTPVCINDFEDDFLVLYFYPKDDTPGCTTETKAFDDALSKFKKLRTRVIGISGGNAKTKDKFCKKHDLSILLLSDTDFAVATKFGVYGEKKFMGRTYNGIFRETFVFGADRKLIHHFDDVKPATHVDEVIDLIKGLSQA